MAYGSDEFGYGSSYSPQSQASSLSNFQANQSLNNANTAASLADPWGQNGNRQQYITRLNNLFNDPNAALSNDPTLKFLQQQGAAAVRAKNAATGQLLGGAGDVALQDRAMGVASTFLPQYESILARLAGVDHSSPGAAANAYTNMLTRSQGQRQMALAQQNAPTPGSGGGFGLPGGGLGGAPTAQGNPNAPYSLTNPTGYVGKPPGMSDQEYAQQLYPSLYNNPSYTPQYAPNTNYTNQTYADGNQYGQYTNPSQQQDTTYTNQDGSTYDPYSQYSDYGGDYGYSDFGGGYS